jgi:hypothetical protein
MGLLAVLDFSSSPVPKNVEEVSKKFTPTILLASPNSLLKRRSLREAFDIV